MRVSREFRRPLIFILLIVCCIGLFILFIPPENLGIVLGFIVLVGFFLYGLSRIWLRKRYAILLSLFGVAFLFIKAAGVFDTINAILLVSLFVGLTILLQ